jgi:hypothetical protein
MVVAGNGGDHDYFTLEGLRVGADLLELGGVRGSGLGQLVMRLAGRASAASRCAAIASAAKVC